MNSSSGSCDTPPWKVIELPATPEVRNEIVSLGSIGNEMINIDGGYLLSNQATSIVGSVNIGFIELLESGFPIDEDWRIPYSVESIFKALSPSGKDNYDWENISPELKHRKYAINLILSDWYTYLKESENLTVEKTLCSSQNQLLKLGVLSVMRESNWIHILDHDSRTAYKIQAFHAIFDAFGSPLEL